MLWPADHPAVTDPALARWAVDVDRLCPGAQVIRVLRHLPSRRVTTLIRTDDGFSVLKLYASSRARGGHQRLTALAASPAGPLVPRSLGHRKGHLLLVEYVVGTPLDQLAGAALVAAAESTGAALRRLQQCGVELARTWQSGEEIAQLRRTAGATTRAVVEEAIAAAMPGRQGPLVPSHRDFYPAQVVAQDGAVRFIDLDDCAMAPAALDLGNFIAHLHKDAIVGRLNPEDCEAAVAAVLAGYGAAPPELDSWTRLALARLAALAETRHRSAEQANQLAGALGRMSVDGGGPSAVPGRSRSHP